MATAPLSPTYVGSHIYHCLALLFHCSQDFVRNADRLDRLYRGDTEERRCTH